MGWSAFAPQGPTVAVAVTVAASAAVQAPPFQGQQNCTNYLVSNASTQGCFLSYGPTAAAALASGVAPIPGTGQNAVWLMGSSTQVFTFGQNAWFSTIAPAATSTVYITPGDGL